MHTLSPVLLLLQELLCDHCRPDQLFLTWATVVHSLQPAFVCFGLPESLGFWGLRFKQFGVWGFGVLGLGFWVQAVRQFEVLGLGLVVNREDLQGALGYLGPSSNRM